MVPGPRQFRHQNALSGHHWRLAGERHIIMDEKKILRRNTSGDSPTGERLGGLQLSIAAPKNGKHGGCGFGLCNGARETDIVAT